MMKKQYMIPTLEVVKLHTAMSMMAGSPTGGAVYDKAADSGASGFAREDDFDWDEQDRSQLELLQYVPPAPLQFEGWAGFVLRLFFLLQVLGGCHALEFAEGGEEGGPRPIVVPSNGRERHR